MLVLKSGIQLWVFGLVEFVSQQSVPVTSSSVKIITSILYYTKSSRGIKRAPTHAGTEVLPYQCKEIDPYIYSSKEEDASVLHEYYL